MTDQCDRMTVPTTGPVLSGLNGRDIAYLMHVAHQNDWDQVLEEAHDARVRQIENRARGISHV